MFYGLVIENCLKKLQCIVQHIDVGPAIIFGVLGEIILEYRYLGTSGIKVSPICLGAMMFGGRSSDAVSGKIIAAARDAGVNFIDTANGYNKGRSERVVGKYIRRHRDSWVLATKVCNPMGEGPNDGGLSRKHILEAVDASLKRMNTDYIDVYYFHKDDINVPLEESIDAVTHLIAVGKVRYWGLSNYRGWRVALACGIARRMDVPTPVVCQPYYNAMDRTPEQEILPACEYHGLGIVAYSPLARGVLTGKYGTAVSQKRKGTRAAVNDPRLMETEWRKENLLIAQEIKKRSQELGITAGQFAFQWVLNNSLVTSVIAGPRTMAQWREYLAGLRYDFTHEDEQFLNYFVRCGHPSTPGYSDPQYPYTGRQAWTD